MLDGERVRGDRTNAGLGIVADISQAIAPPLIANLVQPSHEEPTRFGGVICGGWRHLAYHCVPRLDNHDLPQ